MLDIKLIELIAIGSGRAIFIIFPALFMIYVFFKSYSTFPFTNFSPKWMISLMTTLTIHQIFWIATDIMKYYYPYDDIVSNMIFAVNIYTGYVLGLLILWRFHVIANALECNFQFLSHEVDEKIEDFNKSLRQTIDILTNKRASYFTLLLIFLGIVSLIFIGTWFFLSEEFRSKCPTCICIFYSLTFQICLMKHYYYPQMDCLDILNPYGFIILMVVIIIIDASVVIFSIFFSYKIFLKYSIRKDLFSNRYELGLLALFVPGYYLTSHLLEIWAYERTAFIYDRMFLYFKRIPDIIFDFALVLWYYYLTYCVRNKIDPKAFKTNLQFDLFMQNPIFFKYFGDYIRESGEPCEIFNSLVFWKAIHFYKFRFYEKIKPMTLEQRRQYAILIYDYYLSPINNNNKIRSHEEETNQRSIGISLEKVELANRHGFQFNDLNELYNIFDCHFSEVNSRLRNLFDAMKGERYKDLERLSKYIQFDFSSTEATSEDELNN